VHWAIKKNEVSRVGDEMTLIFLSRIEAPVRAIYSWPLLVSPPFADKLGFGAVTPAFRWS
jgi:hypothetical protein